MTEENVTQNIQETGRKAGKEGRKGRKTALLLLLVLLLLAAVGGGVWWYQKNQIMDATTKYWFDKMAQDGTLEGKNPQEIQGMLDSIVEEGMFNVSLNARAVFENGRSEGSLGMENIPENRYYSRVILRRDDNNEVIYESQGLKPGQYIDKIKLKKNLPAGEYPCTAQIIATDPEGLEDIGQVHVRIQVIVVN